MSYTKTDPQPAALNTGETAVTLDDGAIVAVAVHNEIQDGSGLTVVVATARAIDAAGAPVAMPDGSPVATCARHTFDPNKLDAGVDVSIVQKSCLMAVLGEPTAPLWQDPSDALMLTGFSIRTVLASSAHAGAADADALL